MEYLPYYPSNDVGYVCSDDDEQETQPAQSTIPSKRKGPPPDAAMSVVGTNVVGASAGVRKPGLPKKVVPPLANTKSIMTFKKKSPNDPGKSSSDGLETI